MLLPGRSIRCSGPPGLAMTRLSCGVMPRSAVGARLSAEARGMGPEPISRLRRIQTPPRNNQWRPQPPRRYRPGSPLRNIEQTTPAVAHLARAPVCDTGERGSSPRSGTNRYSPARDWVTARTAAPTPRDFDAEDDAHRDSHCRCHPGPNTQQQRIRLPPAQHGRRQDLPRGHALTQTASRQTPLENHARRLRTASNPGRVRVARPGSRAQIRHHPNLLGSVQE